MSQGAVTPWWSQRIHALDLETTDKDPEQARIVTATVLSVGGGLEVDELSMLADPGVEIPEEAQVIHGISTEMAQENGLLAADVVAEIVRELVRRVGNYGGVLVVYNARYDLTVLDRETRRYGVDQPLYGAVVDPMVIDRHLDRFLPKEVGRHDLQDACRRWGLEFDGEAHDASTDALMAARLAVRLATKGHVIRKTNYPERLAEAVRLRDEWERVRVEPALLHVAQEGWARAAGMGFAAFLRKEGAPAEDIRRCELREGSFWPVIPPDWMSPRPAVGDQLALS